MAKKKIFPTLWWLFRDSLLPKDILFVGYARSKLTLLELRSSFEKNCKLRECDAKKYDEFIKRCSYISVNF